MASDEAFCFVYPETLEALRSAGARLRTFSPVAGEGLPPECDAILLPGGYPELHAGPLSRNEKLRRELRSWVRDGRPLLAECGGMMVLLESLRDLQGHAYPMAAAFPGSTRMSPRLGGFGYVEATVVRSSLFGARGARVHGHLYHHSVRKARPSQPWALRVTPLTGAPPVADGYRAGRALASYVHTRFDRVPGLLTRFLEPE